MTDFSMPIFTLLQSLSGATENLSSPFSGGHDPQLSNSQEGVRKEHRLVIGQWPLKSN